MPQLPRRGEAVGRRHQAANFVGELDLIDDIARRRRAGVLLQHRLAVEQVNLAGAAVHEEVDDPISLSARNAVGAPFGRKPCGSQPPGQLARGLWRINRRPAVMPGQRRAARH